MPVLLIMSTGSETKVHMFQRFFFFLVMYREEKFVTFLN